MDGKLKIIMLIFLFCCCENKNKNDHKIEDTSFNKKGKEFIIENINFLIDSVERFDMSKVPAREKFKDIKIEKFKIGLLDSILSKNNESEFLKFILYKNDLINFKSDYEVSLVKINNYDTKILFVSFSNFRFGENDASIDVKKVIGISMIKNRYYFKKENNKWILKKKQLLSLG